MTLKVVYDTTVVVSAALKPGTVTVKIRQSSYGLTDSVHLII